jgi:hypothetical protein
MAERGLRYVHPFHENVSASEMALARRPWTLLEIAGRKQGFDSPRLQPSPG